MSRSEMENELPARSAVYRHDPWRTVAFVAITLVWALYFCFRPTTIFWIEAMGVFLAAALGYTGLAVAAQAVRGVAILQTSDAGIAINNPWGRMFVPWADTAEFSSGRYRWVRIRLREGAPPVGSIWTRLMSASLWARRTVAVPAFTTIERPAEIANTLTALRGRYCAGA